MRHSDGTSPVPHFILRGGDDGNIVSLPDQRRRAAKYLAGALLHLDGGKGRETLPIRTHCKNLS